MLDRRTRLHDLLLALIKKDANFELIEDEPNQFSSSTFDNDKVNITKVIEKNRKILKNYYSLVKSAVTLDALMDSENEENFKL